MSAKKFQIICTSPGMRRNGIAHPATAFYDAGRWSEAEIKAFNADPNFTVRELEDGESTTTEADFEARVKAEVDSRLQAKAEDLQKAFDQAVSDKAAEKATELQAKIDDLQAKLDAATKAAAEKPATEKPAAKK
ncbi:hypothetical protein [Rhizobium sp. SL86]|uniref:hypothetical protein n=1 Tax=Rhizobium sp. SL86 TaxID=2995148 RepID=UPI002275C60C|nr:hypothetical protein [Rhizobium sp. SL86]MCY1666248.1 hypothetical protein [Rhizobium sp. SL86]MCY1667857.1 hypothetical protein [Rhizobium sp. SL86]